MYTTLRTSPTNLRTSSTNIVICPKVRRKMYEKMYNMLFCTTLFVFYMSLFVQNVVLYDIKRFYYVIIMS